MDGRLFNFKSFTMRNSTLFFVLLLVINFSTKVTAQSFAGFSQVSIVLKADSSTKSVLVSNLVADRTGDQSPIIGTAAWLDSDRQLQCRSFLAFDYGMLPQVIKAEQIISAQLILNPLQVGNIEEAAYQPSKIAVRRVLQPWEGSLTNWLTQPSSTTENEAIKIIPQKKKDRTVKIDVTKIVRSMFEFGNNGFMISYKDSLAKAAFTSQWFASGKNENENIRPLLVINYEVPYQRNYDQKYTALPLTAQDRREMLQNYIRPEPIIETPPVVPVNTPVKEKENN